MKINPNPPGLISRRMFPIDRGRVVVQEEWNIDTPGCPMIRSPFHSQLESDGPTYIRQIEMTAEEYQDMQRQIADQSS